MEWITLTEAETRVCTWVGEQRQAHAVRNHRDPGQGPTKHNTTAVNHIRGALCEFAASLILNLYWRPNIGSINDKDVGGIVQVRSTVLDNGRLIVKPADSDTDPFILIIQQGNEYAAPGWLFAAEAKQFKLDKDHGDAAHYAPQESLRPISELMVLVRDIILGG